MINAIFVPKTTPDLWDSERNGTGVISLDDRLIQAFAGATAHAETEKMAVLQKIEQPRRSNRSCRIVCSAGPDRKL